MCLPLTSVECISIYAVLSNLTWCELVPLALYFAFSRAPASVKSVKPETLKASIRVWKWPQLHHDRRSCSNIRTLFWKHGAPLCSSALFSKSWPTILTGYCSVCHPNRSTSPSNAMQFSANTKLQPPASYWPTKCKYKPRTKDAGGNAPPWQSYSRRRRALNYIGFSVR